MISTYLRKNCVVLNCLCLMIFQVVSAAVSVRSRTVDEISNPWINPEHCGHMGTITSVCNPDNVISEEQASHLDGDIKHILGNVACLCKKSICDQVPGGPRVGIALIQKMKIDPAIQPNLYNKKTSEPSARYLDILLNEARIFSFTLMHRWNMSRCHDDLIIFYSQHDNVLFTATNNATQRKLTDDLIGEISMDVRIHFTQNADSVTEGLKQMLSKYSDVFDEQYMQKSRWSEELYQPQAVLESSASSLHFYSNILAVQFVLQLFLVFN